MTLPFAVQKNIIHTPTPNSHDKRKTKLDTDSKLKLPKA